MVDMAYVVKIVGLIIEVIYLIMIYWWLHGSKKKPGIYTYIYFAMSSILVAMVAKDYITNDYLYINLAGGILVCAFEFEDKLKDAVLYTILNHMVGVTFQFLALAAYLIFVPKEKGVELSDDMQLFFHIVILLLIMLLQWKVEIGKYIQSFIRINYVGNTLIIIVGTLMIILLAIKKHYNNVGPSVIASAIICIAIVALFCMKLYGEIKENITYKERLNLQEKYNLV